MPSRFLQLMHRALGLALRFCLLVGPTTGCSLLAASDETLMGHNRQDEIDAARPEPAVTSGLVFWFDGATGVESHAPPGAPASVSLWRDLSGNRYDAVQGDEALMPEWGEDAFSRRPQVSFKNTQQLVLPPVPLEVAGFTLFLLARPTDFAATDTPVAFGNDGPRLVGEEDADLSFRMTVTEANDVDTPFAWVPGRAAFSVAQVDADGLATVRVNGLSVPESRTVQPVSGTFAVTFGNAATSVAVVGLYNRPLSLAEMTRLERAAGRRWSCCEP